MIVVRLRAGLGNQLFQYAFGRRLAIEYDTDLILDSSWFDAEHDDVAERHFTLPAFDIAGRVGSAGELRRAVGIGPVILPRRLVHLGHRAVEVVNERLCTVVARASASMLNYYWEVRTTPTSETVDWPHSRRFSPQMLDVGPDAYLAGFWQSPKYFEDVADTIRSDLTVRDPPTGNNAHLADEIADTCSVGVHVRRGDFVDLGITLPAGYYKSAAKQLAASLDDPSFFVFSDDPTWARSTLDLPGETTYVTHNDGSADYEDLRLLRRCDHQICSNSTFSWWGAWLNEYPDKHVLTPWDHDVTTSDFVPNDWTTVDY